MDFLVPDKNTKLKQEIPFRGMVFLLTAACNEDEPVHLRISLAGIHRFN
jgi:hypothetical protein